MRNWPDQALLAMYFVVRFVNQVVSVCAGECPGISTGMQHVVASKWLLSWRTWKEVLASQRFVLDRHFGACKAQRGSTMTCHEPFKS